jgi:hypothetical protein
MLSNKDMRRLVEDIEYAGELDRPAVSVEGGDFVVRESTGAVRRLPASKVNRMARWGDLDAMVSALIGDEFLVDEASLAAKRGLML